MNNKIRRPRFYFIIIFFTISLCKAVKPSFYAYTSPLTMALAGSGYLFSSLISSKRNPSVIINTDKFSTGFIRYPAGITSQSFGINFPWRKSATSFDLRYINYGSFDGYDIDAHPTSTYHSSDTWLKINYSSVFKNRPIQFGTATSIYYSALSNHKIASVLFSAGIQTIIKPLKMNFGLTIENLGKTIIQSEKIVDEIEPQIIISILKELSYLPMNIFIDGDLGKNFHSRNISIGGIADITNQMKLLWGTSTKKIDHNIQQSFFRTIFGASGFGFIYDTGDIKLIYGSYIYGVGSLIHGAELEIKF